MWIQESVRRAKRLKDQYQMNGVQVFIKDSLPEEVDPDFVFNYIGSRIPLYLTTNVEMIYVGQFPEMEERDINAFYENDAIYITNEQDDEMDMIEDIVHEISHAIEHYNREVIYGDGKLQREFIAKRKRLSALLSQKYDVPSDFNINFEYDRAIDDFLYRVVGYDVLNQVCVGIFPSAYAATSLSEYWAKGFEELFIGEKSSLKNMCPVLYKKLLTLIKELEDAESGNQ
tara:strand:+ start:492 stop:1178 length:687 start_codon:yes stop_codon:yes gene_type:complete